MSSTLGPRLLRVGRQAASGQSRHAAAASFIPRPNLASLQQRATAITVGFQARTMQSTMSAVVIDGPGVKIDTQRAIPQLREDASVLIKVKAVALNPTDWKHIRNRRAKDGCIVGCDYAGVVEAVGSGVSAGKKWKVGDRIYGCSHGANLVNPDDGVLAEKAVVRGDLAMRMPPGWGFKQAATLGLGTITVGQGLYQKAMQLDLPGTEAPKRKDEHVLIYGGGTATAALAIQFAKQSGYSVVTICGPESYDYVKSLGADASFDFHDKNVGPQVREYTDNKLRFAWDTIGNDTTARICAESLASGEADLKSLYYGTINPTKCPRDDVTSTSTVMYTVFGKEFQFGDRHLPALAEDYEFGKRFYAIAEQLYTKGLVKPHRFVVRPGGLEGVIQGLQELEAGKVKGEKLVYSIN